MSEIEEELFKAVYYKNLDMIKEIVNTGINVNIVDGYGDTLLYHSVIACNKEVVEYLINQGANINTWNHKGYTPLHKAISFYHLTIAELFIKEGAYINAATNNCDTPLHLAVEINCIPIVELLINKGANLTVQNNSCFTPLHLAKNRGHHEIIKLLEEAQAKQEQVVEEHEEIRELFNAVHSCDIEELDKLIKSGVDVNAQDNYGRKPLHIAVENGCRDMVDMLLQKGVDVDVQDNFKRTPLHIATYAGYLGIVELLISQGADPTIQKKDGKTPLDLAKDRGFKEIVCLLEKAQAKQEQVEEIETGKTEISISHIMATGLYLSEIIVHNTMVNIKYGQHLIITGGNEKQRECLFEQIERSANVYVIKDICAYLSIQEQKEVLPNIIKEAKTQVVVSTHSPFVISSISNAVIVNLDNGFAITDLSGYSYGCLIESFFHSDEYSIELTNKVERFGVLVDKKDDATMDEKEEIIHLKAELTALPKYASDELTIAVQQSLLKLRHK